MRTYEGAPARSGNHPEPPGWTTNPAARELQPRKSRSRRYQALCMRVMPYAGCQPVFKGLSPCRAGEFNRPSPTGSSVAAVPGPMAPNGGPGWPSDWLPASPSREGKPVMPTYESCTPMQWAGDGHWRDPRVIFSFLFSFCCLELPDSARDPLFARLMSSSPGV